MPAYPTAGYIIVVPNLKWSIWIKIHVQKPNLIQILLMKSLTLSHLYCFCLDSFLVSLYAFVRYVIFTESNS